MQNSVANILKIIKEFVLEARIEKAYTIASIVLLLISGSKISLYQLGIGSSNKPIKLKSKEQKIRRLLAKFPITSKIYAKAIFALFGCSSVELIIDRTNWMFGITNINYLMLSIRWQNIAIPIYWIMLDNKGGNSSSKNRIELINWFITNFSNITIDNIYADREFPSVEFISWLLHKDRNINFIFRTKNSIQASDGNKKVSLAKLYCKLLQHKHKTKSFNLESTHITNYKRLSALFTLMAISYAYCCKIGVIANSINPIKIKKLRNTKNNKTKYAPEFTCFKYGFYLLKNFFDNFLCDSAVFARQLYQILNYPAQTTIPKRLRITAIIAAF
jgi:hypothetical protein